MPKRNDYISWDEYFMGIALLSARRSKDPSTQVGACIVNSRNKIMSVGYNGFPQGCSDDDFPWERSGDEFDTKYPYVCHAELNAILNSGGSSLEYPKETFLSSTFPPSFSSESITTAQFGLTFCITNFIWFSGIATQPPV